MGYVVAVDGASGTGKGTVTRIVAEKLGLVTIDTGALYRCVTLEVLNKNISFDDVETIENITKNMNVELKVENNKQYVYLNGEDVSVEIRTPRVTSNVSEIAAIKEVRAEMVHIQRRLAKGKNVIMEGRDIGTTVFPDADVKIFLECSAEERAKRRVQQNKENGIEITGSIFTKSSKQLKENIEFIKQNYGEEYLTPLIISKNLKNLQKILPYLQRIGVLETVKNSASILKLTLEEIKERQAFAEKIGEPIVKNGRFNSIFGLSRKNYQKKVKEFAEKQELIGEIKGAIQEGKILDKQISDRKKERNNGR